MPTSRHVVPSPAALQSDERSEHQRKSRRGHGDTFQFALPETCTAPDDDGSSPDATRFLAAFAALVYRTQGLRNRPVLVEATLHDTDNPSAWLSIDLSDDPTFSQIVNRVAEGLRVASPQATSTLAAGALARFVYRFGPDRHQPDRESADDIGEGTCVSELRIRHAPTSAQARLWRHDAGDPGAAERLTHAFLRLLEAGIQMPHCPLSQVPLLSPIERRRILFDWNDTATSEGPVPCLHQLFEASVRRTPDAPAVTFEDRTWTYRELDERATRLARALQARGVRPGTLVGICVDRSLEMLAGLLGILKAGGAYVPLDPAFPAERLRWMLEDSQAPLIVTQERLLATLPPSQAEVICLDRDWNEISVLSADPLPPTAGRDHLAYVIFTSGSTGRPKGVQISHRAVVNFMQAMQGEPGFHSRDVLVAVTTLSFDIACLELFLPLVAGGRVVVASRDVAVDGERLARLLQTSGATVMQATPATWRLLLDVGWPGSGSLKALCGGEALPRDLAHRLVRVCHSLWNMYGPTETTIWSTLEKVLPDQQPIAIGRPIANTRIYILDRFLQPVPVGTPGELFIGGAGLARGYLDRPHLTAEKFVPDPFLEPGLERMYRTGDLARYLPDGRIECLGRVDHQVKIRGYRIELGEIEAALATHPAVRQGAVGVCNGPGGEKRLVAYFVARGDVPPSAQELRVHLKTSLPDYMVPSRFVPLGALPLTPNGKIDRRALPALDALPSEAAEDTLSPRTPQEELVARIWREVLGTERVGILDPFFDLGGTSLLAGRVFARLKKETGCALAPTALLQAATVAELAALLTQDQQDPAGDGCLVPIQPEGAAPPLFCLHAGAGTVLFYRDLARELGRDQPVYGLQARGLYDHARPLQSVEEMAAHYIQEIRAVQPDGPYFLAGFCFGAILAFEMAQQLTRQEQEIGLLASLDGPSPPKARARRPGGGSRPPSPPRHRPATLEVSLRRKATHLWEAISWRLGLKPMVMRYRLGRLCLALGGSLPDFVRESYFLAHHVRLERRYCPKPYPGGMVILQTEGSFGDRQLGWGSLIQGRIEVHELPGEHREHRDLMKDAFVPHVAERLRRHLHPPRANGIAKRS